MKKILLFCAVAALYAGTANALPVGKFQPAARTAAVKSAMPQQKQMKAFDPAAHNIRCVANPAFSKKFTFAAPMSNDLTLTMPKPAVPQSVKGMKSVQQMAPASDYKLMPVAPKAMKSVRRQAPASLQPKYAGHGYEYNGSGWVATDPWTMATGYGEFADGTTVDLLYDVIPDLLGLKSSIEDYADGVYLECTTDGDQITVEPQIVAATQDNSGNVYYLYFVNYTSLYQGGDGSFVLTVDETGNLSFDKDNSSLMYAACLKPESGSAFPGLSSIKSAYEWILPTSYTIGEAEEVPANSYTVLQTYTGVAKDYEGGSAKWTMERGTYYYGSADTTFNVLTDVIPVPSYWASSFDYVTVECTVEGNTITVPAQPVASNSSYTFYLCDPNSADGSITMTLNADGTIETAEDQKILYAAFSGDFDISFGSDYAGYVEYMLDVNYYAEGQEIPVMAPEVSYMPAGLPLYAGLSRDFYSYYSSFGFVPPYASVAYTNTTTDDADEWLWTVDELEYNSVSGAFEVVDTQTSTDRDFNFATTNGIYSHIKLYGANQGVWSDYYASLDSVTYSSTGRTYAPYMYAGFMGSSFDFGDDTDSDPVQITAANVDNGLGILPFSPYSANSQISMSKYISYQGKPEKPLFTTGINILLYSFSATNADDLGLTCQIYQCHRNSSGKVILDDMIAESTTTEALDGYSNYKAEWINFTDFYNYDEDGMTYTLDYLFLDQEFAIVFTGCDSGKFSGSIFCESDMEAGTTTTNFFYETGDDETLNYFTSAGRAFVGFNYACWGYLNCEGNKNEHLSAPAEGGTVSLTIHPMVYTYNESGEAATTLYIDDDSETPDWISEITFANEDYTGEDELSFDLVFTCDALPEGLDGRSATIRFWQIGAYIDVTIGQGEFTGINAVTADRASYAAGTAYNVYGQPVTAGYKGIAVRNGVKYIAK